jgi:Ca2+-transporting ATPase
LATRDLAARRAIYGENQILEQRRGRWSAVIADTATDPMMWFLLGTSLLFAWVGDLAEAAILAAALAPIAGMDAFLHWRTHASTESLRDRLATRARVVRDGRISEAPASDLVPGDLVRVDAGAWFPADGLLESGERLQVDESTLTGEAMPVAKHPPEELAAIQPGVPVADAAWANAGTRLLTGSATLRVVFTGAETIYGQIARSVQGDRAERTPLQHAIGRLVAALLVAAVVACAALAVTRLLQGHGVIDALLSAATLGVAALPEEFPVVFTFFLGVGVFRLARRRALVRRAVAVENIGRVTCICSDKTGTLTEGRLSLTHVIPADGVELSRLMQSAAFASRRESADPMDLAILSHAPGVPGERLATFPFTEDRRRETSVVQGPSGGVLVAVKGAPETVLSMTGASAEQRSEQLRRTEELAASAHKVIACAVQRLDSWSGGEPSEGYDFLGLLAFEDPLRKDAGAAIAAAQGAGIRVIMVTGDYPVTARAIAREAGLGRGEPVVVDGEALARSLDGGSSDAADGFHVVARATPAHKLKLVKWLKRAGEIVAVTGDGVNDAPALRAADIGIAMGARGAQTARDVASIVLLDDSLSTVVAAIREGRQLFHNLQLAFAYLLMVHAPLVVTAAAIPFVGEPLLYLPTHIVWLELIFHPTALLVFQELPSNGELGRIERRAQLQFFGRRQVLMIGLAAIIASGAVILAYQRALLSGHDVETARSAAMAAMVLASAAIAAGLSRLRTRSAMLAVTAAGASAIVLIQTPPLASLMHLAPLDPAQWAWAAAGAAVVGVAARGAAAK